MEVEERNSATLDVNVASFGSPEASLAGFESDNTHRLFVVMIVIQFLECGIVNRWSTF